MYAGLDQVSGTCKPLCSCMCVYITTLDVVVPFSTMHSKKSLVDFTQNGLLYHSKSGFGVI